MSIKESQKDLVLFLCSPNLGILDNWLPAIWKLKKKRSALSFVFIIPIPDQVEKISLDSVLFILSQKIFDRVIFRSHSGAWLSASSFSEAKDLNTIKPNIAEKLLFFLIGRLESHRKTLFLSSFVEAISPKLAPWGMVNKMTQWSSLMKRTACLLYDVNKDKKWSNHILMKKLKNVTKFSLLHGINLKIEAKHKLKQSLGHDNVYAYLYSEKDRTHYNKNMQVPDSNIKVVGIPRHCPEWIDTLVENIPGEKEFFLDDYIFVISRAANPAYFPLERKRKAIEAIKTLAWHDLNKKLVVKLHPNEKNEGLYEEILGAGNLGDKWFYSNLHPLILGRKCVFAVCFYSGVAIDMTALGVPTIEIFDVRGLSKYDNKNSLRDEHGSPVRVLRYMNLVLGANDYDQMKAHALEIINNRQQVVNRLQTTYDNLFPRIKNVNDYIADDILSVIEKNDSKPCA